MSLIVFSTMFSSYFASITEHSFLCICKVFISKEFVRFSYGLGRFYASKRIIQSKDFDTNVHAHSVSSAIQRVQCPFGRRWIMCNPFQGSIPYGELIISFEKSEIPFGELKISFERSKIPFGERIISFGRAKIPFGEKFIIAL